MARKKDLTDDEIVKIYKTYLVNGYTRKIDMIKGIRDCANCTNPTAYNILYRHTELFTYNERKRAYHLYSTYYFNPEEFKVPPQKTELLDKLLDKISLFVCNKPSVDDFLITISALRDQVADGVFDNLDKLEVMLEQRFGLEAKKLVEESKILRETATEGTEEIVCGNEETEPFEPELEVEETQAEEEEEEETTEVVEMV